MLLAKIIFSSKQKLVNQTDLFLKLFSFQQNSSQLLRMLTISIR